MSHAIITSDISVQIQGKTILHPTSISIKKGENVGIIGRNGAGKSTFMKAMLGLITHSGGSNLSSKTLSDRVRLASWVPQDRELVWDIKVETLLQFTIEKVKETENFKAIKKFIDTKEALSITGTLKLANARIKSLSGGELTSVLIARALVQQTSIIFLDEPLASLDPIQKRTILEVLQEMSQSGKTIISSLHDIELGKEYFSKYIAMREGSVICEGTPLQILKKKQFDKIFVEKNSVC